MVEVGIEAVVELSEVEVEVAEVVAGQAVRSFAVDLAEYSCSARL